ncbi:MAG: MaoC family dehydratase N-terminal domain-containing protein [Dehalococcoidia bacterium]|jgi:acyl dehydratase|nr:MaoC family dehydratase N-terminal domain-containing protein [Dehalococcoidia bacterium]
MGVTAISAEARAMIGKQATPQTCEVTTTAIRRFAQAVGDANPVYVDESHAAKSKWGGIIAPPTFFFTLGYYADAPGVQLREDGRSVGGALDVPLPVSRTVGGASAIEFGVPARPGDVITVNKRIADVHSKEGKSGLLYFTVVETSFTNQKGELVARETASFIER